LEQIVENSPNCHRIKGLEKPGFCAAGCLLGYSHRGVNECELRWITSTKPTFFFCMVGELKRKNWIEWKAACINSLLFHHHPQKRRNTTAAEIYS
jgi:hypothetical protein